MLRRLVRVSVVLAMVPMALVLAVSSASASTADGVAANSMAFGIVGPVGIAAVVVGFGGLITGLVRHRRRETATPARQPVVERVASDR
jgi:hypothetical protein